MAGIKISALPAASSAQLTDVFPADQSGPITRKISLSQVATLLSSNFVELNPSGNQVITSNNLTLQAGNMTALQGTFSSGSIAGGVSGSFRAFAINAASGSNNFLAANNAGNYANVLTNASTTSARTWTLPDSTGTIALTSGASGIVNSGLINQLAYYAAAGTTVSGLATAANGVLITSSGSVPSISSTLPSAVQLNITQLGSIAQSIFYTNPGAAGTRYLAITGATNTFDGQMILQAGGGSAAYGGGLIMYGHSHATKPGWVTAGISSGSGGFFTVNNQGIGGGSDVFTISATGTVVANQGINAKAGAIISGLAAGGFVGNVACYSTTANRGYIEMLANNNATGNFGSTIKNSTAQAQNQTLTIPDVGGATANFAMVPAALVSGNLPMASGTLGVLADSGIVAANVALKSGSGFTYNSVAGTSQAAVGSNAYILNNAGATTVTLPTSASSTIGDTIKIKGRSAAPWIIQANTSQVITYGSVSSTSAGTATSAAGTDSLQLVYVAANEWSVDWALSSGIILA